MMAKLGDICDVRDGTHDSPSYVDTGYPLVTSKNIVDGELDLSVVNYIALDDYNKINERSKVDDGDIIMPMIGTIGNPYLVNGFTDFAIKNVALIKFNDKKINNKYIYYFLNSDKFKEYIAENNRGGTQKFLSLKDIRNMEINIVSLDEQLEIVAILDKISNLIKCRQEQLSKLDELVKSRFIELFGEVETNVKGFPMKRMEECCKFIGGAQPDKSHFEYEKTDDNIRLIQIRDYKSDRFITYIPKSLARKTCTASDIMIGRYGPPIFQILGGIEGAYNVALMKAVPSAEFNTEYFRYFLKNEKLLHYLESFSQRTAGQDGIQIDKLNAYPCFVPPMELQILFAAFVEQTDKSKLAVQQSIEKLETLKKSLMQQYFG